MPIEINGKTFYRTAEICVRAGISRATLFRWLKSGVLKKTYRDRRGWRMFTEEDLNAVKTEAETVKVYFSRDRKK